MDQEFIFSPNSSINSEINELLPFFDAASQKRMIRSILNAKIAAEKYGDENTDANARHIFREFIPAGELNRNGFSFEYERPILGKKPDWIDNHGKMMIESYTYERGGSTDLLDRLSTSINQKCVKYSDIVSINRFRLLITVYLDFYTGYSLEECIENKKEISSIFTNNELRIDAARHLQVTRGARAQPPHNPELDEAGEGGFYLEIKGRARMENVGMRVGL